MGIGLPHDRHGRLGNELLKSCYVVCFGRVCIRVVVVDRRKEREVRRKMKKITVKLVTLVNKKLASWVKFAAWSKTERGSDRIAGRNTKLPHNPYQHARGSGFAMCSGD